MRECVFCGGKKLSKEHVWSSCLLEKRRGNKKYSSSAVPDKFIGPNALQIRDVCEKCNSNNLSELDGYFCQLYDDYIKNIIHEGDQISFNYNYSLLSRWLLKTLYNNARAGKAELKFINLLSQYNDYILNEQSGSPEFLLFLQLIIPYSNDGAEIPPTFMTAGPIQIPMFDARNAFLFVICIDSYRFIFAIPQNGSRLDTNEIINKIPQLPATNGATLLTNSEKAKLIKASDVNALYAVGPALMPDLGKWIELINSKK